MRILNEYDREITPMEVDGSKGYLELEKLVLAKHEATEETQEESHYFVKSVQFSNGTSYQPMDENDPHIVAVDADNGVFDFDPMDEDFPSVAGIDVELIIDVPYTPKQDAWEETEFIERYKLFTDKELEKNRREEKEKEEIIKFIKGGDKRVKALEEKIKELEQKIKDLS